ncbi:hypothetical protein BJF80_05590 [Serinicoccus sp. CUA-874]|nr:hypothetical protein BJF80_05590 [Serinicoccus sp. CUA-874]
MIAALRDATSFLTRVPLPQREGFDLARAAWAFPIVGAGVGAVVGALAWGASLLVPPLVAATLAVLAEVLLTGALHLDGLADCADGCGGRDRESRLRIMKDHAVGVYGTAAVVLALVLQIAAVQALLGSLEWWGVVAVLASVGALSRSGMLTVALRLRRGGPRGRRGRSCWGCGPARWSWQAAWRGCRRSRSGRSGSGWGYACCSPPSSCRCSSRCGRSGRSAA